jgi:hypothetical protein
VVNVGVFGIALGTLAGDIGDAVHRVGAGDKPATALHDGEHFAAQGAEFIGILKVLKEKIAFVVEAAAQFFGVVLRVV